MRSTSDIPDAVPDIPDEELPIPDIPPPEDMLLAELPTAVLDEETPPPIAEVLPPEFCMEDIPFPIPDMPPPVEEALLVALLP